MNDIRNIEVFKNEKWEKVTFDQLRKGDLCRTVEPNGEEVFVNKNDIEFKAASNPYGSDGV